MKNQLLTSLSTRDKIYQAAWAWYQDYMRVLNTFTDRQVYLFSGLLTQQFSYPLTLQSICNDLVETGLLLGDWQDLAFDFRGAIAIRQSICKLSQSKNPLEAKLHNIDEEYAKFESNLNGINDEQKPGILLINLATFFESYFNDFEKTNTLSCEPHAQLEKDKSEESTPKPRP